MTTDDDPPPDNEPADAVNADPLSFIAPRANPRAARARDSRTTRFISRLRFIVPVGSVLLLAILVAWPWIDPNKIKTQAMKEVSNLAVGYRLSFSDRDSKNQPYSMSATLAKRAEGLAEIYDLDKPEGEIQLENGAWVAGKAQYGRYDKSTRRLWLGGNVQLFHDKGYQFTTDEAQIDIDADDAWGEKPVLIQGNFGEIRGQGFRVLDSGTTMVVKGPAKAILNLHSNLQTDQASDTPAEEPKP